MVPVPQYSDAYLVAWDPSHHTGKLWVAVGVVEDFSDSTVSDFVYWMEETQAFHEVDGEIKDQEESCVVDDMAEDVDAEMDPSGCSQAGRSVGTLAGLSWGWGAIFGIIMAAAKISA